MIPRPSVEGKDCVWGETIIEKYLGTPGYWGYIWDTGIEDIFVENVVIKEISNMW